MSFKDLGIIKKLKLEEKGYYRLIISVNKPFYTKYLQFNVWRKESLHDSDGQQLGLEDQVEAEYYFKGNFPQLTSLTKACIEYCPVCFNTLERIETQRMDCNGCSEVPCYEHKERINTKMILISCAEKQYRYSTGYRLELSAPSLGSSFISVVFPNKPLLRSILPNLQVGKVYTVLGWRDRKLFDLVDIVQTNDHENLC